MWDKTAAGDTGPEKVSKCSGGKSPDHEVTLLKNLLNTWTLRRVREWWKCWKWSCRGRLYQNIGWCLRKRTEPVFKFYGKIYLRLRPGINAWKTIIQLLVLPGKVMKSCKLASVTYWNHRVYVNTSIAWSTCVILTFIYLFWAKSLTPFLIHKNTCNPNNNWIYLHNLEIFALRHPRDQLKLFEKNLCMCVCVYVCIIYKISKPSADLAWLKTIRLCNHLAPVLLKYWATWGAE